MLTLFYPPFRATDDVEMLELSVKGIRAYAEDLADQPEHILRRAWREVRRAHKVERWPTIQTILEACQTGDGPARKPGGLHPATPQELDYQRRAYGQVYMTIVTDADADYHRRQAEAKERGEIRGRERLNPFGRKSEAA